MGVPLLKASVEPIVAGSVGHINIIPNVFSFNPSLSENRVPKSHGLSSCYYLKTKREIWKA